jgi:hypothetical protein
VQDLPQFEHVNQLCDGCLANKHWCSPFPEQVEFWSNRVLELVHVNLCSPIKPTTPSGKKLFVLLVNDYNRFMWVALVRSKDEALDAIKHV